MARPYQKHGLVALKRRLSVRGMGGIDRRCRAARALREWRVELESDLGGAVAISAQQRAIIDVASTTKLLLDSVDRWLLEQEDGLVNRKRRAVYPVVLQRQQLADSLARQMALLGLERRQRSGPSLAEYVAEKYGHTGNEPPHDPHQEAQHDNGDEDPHVGGTERATSDPCL
jgi:hypothetical protein